MSCRNIIYMQGVLIRLLIETKLQHSTFCYQIEKNNFWLFGKMYTNATTELATDAFLKTWTFTDMNFSEPLQTVALFGTFISSSENHKSHYTFSFIISISIKAFFYGFEECFFKIFRKLLKETAWWGLYFITPQVSGSGISRTNNQ